MIGIATGSLLDRHPHGSPLTSQTHAIVLARWILQCVGAVIHRLGACGALSVDALARRVTTGRSRPIAVTCLLGLLSNVGAVGQVPSWSIDSSTDRMNDQKIVWAMLPAVLPLDSKWGTFRPHLQIVCFTELDTASSSHGLGLRLFSQLAPNIEDVDEQGVKTTTIKMRFDSESAEPLEAIISATGNSFPLTPSRPLDPTSDLSYDEEDGNRLRDALVHRLLAARRLLVEFTLVTDETFVAEFRPGIRTRGILKRIYAACNQDLPT